jgi:hypothetical protein
LIIESWEDALDLHESAPRPNPSDDDMNASMSASNESLSAGLRQTARKIAANQRLLEKLIRSRP